MKFKESKLRPDRRKSTVFLNLDQKNADTRFTIEHDVRPFFSDLQNNIIEIATDNPTRYLREAYQFKILFPEEGKQLHNSVQFKEHITKKKDQLESLGDDKWEYFIHYAARAIVLDPSFRTELFPSQADYTQQLLHWNEFHKRNPALYVIGDSVLISFVTIFPEYRETDDYKHQVQSIKDDAAPNLERLRAEEAWTSYISVLATIRQLDPKARMPVQIEDWKYIRKAIMDDKQELDVLDSSSTGWSELLNDMHNCAIVAAYSVSFDERGMHLFFREETKGVQPLPDRSVI